MGNAITLPPLPVHTLDREEVYSGIAVNKVCTVLYYTADQLRARDLEVARVVLEAAASECRAIELAAWREYKIGRRTSAHTEGRSDGAGECVAVIKALEFHHE